MLKLALIGNSISKSLSPKLMEFFARKVNVSLTYDLIDLPSDCANADLLSAISSFDGVNITAPFKMHVGSLLGGRSVNTVVNRNGTLRSFSTDGFGVVLALACHDIDTDEKDLLILGAGGSAYSAAAALKYENANVKVINRTQSKADSITRELELKEWQGEKPYGILSFLPPRDTLFGVKNEDVCGANFCFDANYQTASPLLDLATKSGVTAINGLIMLYYQGVAAFQVFTGKVISQEKIDLWYKEFCDEIIDY